MRRWSTKVLAAVALLVGGALFTTMGVLVVSNWWVHRRGRPETYDALTEIPARDVAIVPGVGGKLGIINDRLRSRLVAAVALYRAHKVKSILVSGIGGDAGSGDEVSSSRFWLIARGVDGPHILTDPAGFRTLDTMQRAAHAYHVSSAVICTQPRHLDRSLFLARAAGIDAVGFAASMHQPLNNPEVRLETLKITLAFLDTYLLHRGPLVEEPTALVASTL